MGPAFAPAPRLSGPMQTILHLTGLPPRVQKGELAHSGVNLDVDTARELVESCRRTPWQGDTTTVHLTAAHRVGEDVWNTLLKILEEPPPYLQFHLYAPSTDSVPRTIKSRSHVTREHLPSPPQLDATRLVRLYEQGDALAIIREADRHTEQGDTLRELDGLWTHSLNTGRLDAATLTEYYQSLVRRGGNTRTCMKALLTTLAIRHRETLRVQPT